MRTNSTGPDFQEPRRAVSNLTHVSVHRNSEDYLAASSKPANDTLADLRDRGVLKPARRTELEDNEPPPEPESYPFLYPPVEPDEIGRLGNYRVLRLLGKGGMAYVFLAEDIALRRQVAIKVMKPDLNSDPSSWQRFLREARTGASIKHEHLVTVYQVGQEGTVVYLAMELLHGETIEDWIKRTGKAKVPDVLRIAKQIAAGLVVIHEKGLIHRDIKPSNLWLENPEKHVKILDFGLARQMDDNTQFTQSGIIVGTPAFMSPEQARGEQVDERSDLFSLGSVLYFICSGTRPFNSDKTIALLTALVMLDPRPVRELNPTLPKGLCDLIMRLLAKDPDQRPANAAEVLQLLNQIDEGDTIVSESADDDFSCFSLPADDTEVMSKESKTRSRQPKYNKWGLAIGLAAAFVVCAAVAVVAAIIGPRSPSSAQAQQREKNPPPKSQQPIEKKIAGAAPVKPKLVYLSDLTPSEIKDWIKVPPGPPDFQGRPPGEPDFGPEPPPLKDFPGVKIAGLLIPHGIFMHAPHGPNGGKSRLGYTLNRRFDVFQAEVSLNDGPEQSLTPLTFSVYGDGKLLWQSGPVQTQEDAQKCSFSIKNVNMLVIEVDCPGEPRGAHAAWIDPQVSK